MPCTFEVRYCCCHFCGLCRWIPAARICRSWFVETGLWLHREWDIGLFIWSWCDELCVSSIVCMLWSSDVTARSTMMRTDEANAVSDKLVTNGCDPEYFLL
ncbi:hypothetical protein M758_UG288900 [Ceratodon purpureus]|nr:hypothetical protein M758_UG288900 [Ceratodon purpureus]